MNAGGTNPARIERVPHMPALTGPEVVFARRPTTLGAPDAGRDVALVLIRLAVNTNGGLVIPEGAHASIL
jgi:hypothetical protein